MKKSIKIDDLNIEYTVIARKVKYWRLEIKDEKLILISPQGCIDHEKIIQKHKKWIYKKFSEITERKMHAELIEISLKRDDQEFKKFIIKLIDKYSCELNVSINKVYFKKMKSRWGSCSSKKNISINTYLNYLPEKLVKYVVFHEIVHLLQLNHSKNFWDIISLKFPEHKDIEKELSIYWFAIKDQYEII